MLELINESILIIILWLKSKKSASRPVIPIGWRGSFFKKLRKIGKNYGLSKIAKSASNEAVSMDIAFF